MDDLAQPHTNPLHELARPWDEALGVPVQDRLETAMPMHHRNREPHTKIDPPSLPKYYAVGSMQQAGSSSSYSIRRAYNISPSYTRNNTHYYPLTQTDTHRHTGTQTHTLARTQAHRHTQAHTRIHYDFISPADARRK